MKKILGYTFVGLVSAASVLTLNEYLNTKKETTNQIQNVNETSNKAQTTFANQSAVDFVNYDAPNLTGAAEKSLNAVVNVKNFGQRSQQQAVNPFDFFFGFPQQRGQQQQKPQNDEPVQRGHGSGVIISPDGYIVTNNHVIDGATKLEVTLNNQVTYPAELVGTDPNTDIALLKVKGKNLPYLDFFNSDNVKVGEWVLAVGNPFSLTSTVTAGIVSAKGRSIDILRKKSDSPIESFIQTDAAINPGNSGGALVNSNGDLVGINTAIHSKTGTYEGYGFAVPANLVKKIIEDIKKYGIVQRGYLGVMTIDLSSDKQVKAYNKENGTSYKTRQGVLVANLTKDGGAIDAGLEKGDIITSVNGRRVNKFSDLSASIGKKRPGDKVNVTVIRQNKTRTYAVTLKDSRGSTKARAKSDLTVAEKLGAKFTPLSAKTKQRFGLDHGVVVSSVSGNGELAKIGIRESYILLKVNNKAVKSSADIERILKNYKGDVSIRYVDGYGRIYTGGFSL